LRSSEATQAQTSGELLETHPKGSVPYNVAGDGEREWSKRTELGNQQPSLSGMSGRFND
jgi:hypothetical protein